MSRHPGSSSGSGYGDYRRESYGPPGSSGFRGRGGYNSRGNDRGGYGFRGGRGGGGFGGSSYSPYESRNARLDEQTHSGESTPDHKRHSSQDDMSYRSSPGEYRGGYRGRGGSSSFRGSYRGGYNRGKDTYSPYRRESNIAPSNIPDSRSNSTDFYTVTNTPPKVPTPSNIQDPQQSMGYQRKSQSNPIKYKSPWIELLRLNEKRSGLEQIDSDLKLKELIKEQEEIYQEQEILQKKYLDQKLKNLKLEFEVGTLKEISNKDSLNVELTQEKLDTISFI
ncbi:Collagen alpha-5(VI) chain [Wickerhamomyces ciferrii]|uniref:Collagen alpha-5(VI) chain n=1 Tax=Wickerhamomyces ciferrii (strain ATCC 14091 / BCRC 22168 / CBS 111 / JCM 3599 / NBRC 0793 / NRRL Y-1031 F-60-10) TaxID=1206466 RepID=K0KBE8_WICCF|nr:Collagen alpha-5(VI) chain [Wickerhamomyces ciferrii]CCH42340.1 Collagen alpha-5(VI) chain [Wickerhamomyces ciferrii]